MQTEPGRCYVCHRWCRTEVHHLLNGHGLRKKCTEDRLLINVCPECHRLIHSDAKLRLMLKQEAQEVFEHEIGIREQFIQRYGKSYL